MDTSFNCVPYPIPSAGVTVNSFVLNADGASMQLWGLGHQLLRWSVGGRELLYKGNLDEMFARPTRGGIPILFPFPNRIRAGQFAFNGRTYVLPKNDSTQENAIHGYTPRVGWGAVTVNSNPKESNLASTFDCLAADDGRHNWPCPYRLTVTIDLTGTTLRYAATVENTHEALSLPFGLGYHPYFRVTPESRIQTPAMGRWELKDSLPTGRILPLDDAYDLHDGKLVRDLTLDDVYTVLPKGGPREIARLFHPDGVLSVVADGAFRELVLFTPPHREAIAIEPYTCPTDAANLANRGLETGWTVLPPGGEWSAAVEYRWTAN